MTIEERAKEYIANCHTAPLNKMGRLQGYIRGATDQRKIDIQIVCHALEKVLHKDILTSIKNLMEE